MPTDIVRFGGYQGEASVHTRAARALGEAIRRRLGDEVGFDLTGNVTEQGHDAADLLAMVERGDLDLCYFASSYLVRRVPALAVFDLPFRVVERARVHAALDGALGRRIAAAVAGATGYLVLGTWDNGLRHISNRVRPIRHPDDCRGLRIRTLDNVLHQEVFRALGFEPVAIDVKHLARAVADGAVDAQENPLTNLVNFGLHRSHRHVSLTGHFFGVALVLANRERFAGWPAQLREAVTQAIAEATAAQRRFAVAEDALCLTRLTADGVEVVPAEAIDRAAFAAAVADVAAREAAAIDHEVLAALDGVDPGCCS